MWIASCMISLSMRTRLDFKLPFRQISVWINIGSNVCANHVVVVYNTWTTCTPNFVLKVNQPDSCTATTERCRTDYCPSWNMIPILRQNHKGLTNILVSNYKNPIEIVTWQINSSLLKIVTALMRTSWCSKGMDVFRPGRAVFFWRRSRLWSFVNRSRFSTRKLYN